MLANQIFTVALGIKDPWYIEDIKLDDNTKRLDIHVSFRRGSAFTSNKDAYPGAYKVYDSQVKTWRHLNFFEYECYLHCKTPRIDLDNGKTEVIKPPWAGLSNGFTLLFEAFIVQLCTISTPKSAAQLLGIHDTMIWRLLEKYVIGARAEEDYSQVSTVGIDETSLRKKHDYVTLFVDLENRRTMFVTDGKDNQTIKRFAADLRQHKGKAENIKKVSIDMSPAFIKGIKENLPDAEITYDKFHLIKAINEAVNNVRKEEVVEQPLLKGTRYLFLKNEKNLTSNQRNMLDDIKLSKYKLKSYRALRIREAFQEIYKAESKDTFEVLLNKWYFWATHSRLVPIKTVAKMIKSHWSGILSWFSSRINNGILEGINSVIQAAKAKSRGFKSFQYFRTMIYLLTGHFDYSKINKHYVPIK